MLRNIGTIGQYSASLKALRIPAMSVSFRARNKNKTLSSRPERISSFFNRAPRSRLPVIRQETSDKETIQRQCRPSFHKFLGKVGTGHPEKRYFRCPFLLYSGNFTLTGSHLSPVAIFRSTNVYEICMHCRYNPRVVTSAKS